MSIARRSKSILVTAGFTILMYWARSSFLYAWGTLAPREGQSREPSWIFSRRNSPRNNRQWPHRKRPGAELLFLKVKISHGSARVARIKEKKKEEVFIRVHPRLACLAHFWPWR